MSMEIFHKTTKEDDQVRNLRFNFQPRCRRCLFFFFFFDIQKSSLTAAAIFSIPKSMLQPEQGADLQDSTSSQLSVASGTVDPVLFNDLVELVPLVQSLINNPKPSSSFAHRGSAIYTKTPLRESLMKIDLKPRNVAQSILKKNHLVEKKHRNSTTSKEEDACRCSTFSSRNLAVQKDMEELVALREKVEDLQAKLSEKDELLKSSLMVKNQIEAVHAKIDELTCEVVEKDSLIKSMQQKLTESKIKLADKQAALEKMQWTAMVSSKEVAKLQDDLISLRGDVSSFMSLFQRLAENGSAMQSHDHDTNSCFLDPLSDIGDVDELVIQNMEEAREAYVAAVAAAKQKQDDESLAVAATARLHLQSLVFKTQQYEPDAT